MFTPKQGHSKRCKGPLTTQDLTGTKGTVFARALLARAPHWALLAPCWPPASVSPRAQHDLWALSTRENQESSSGHIDSRALLTAPARVRAKRSLLGTEGQRPMRTLKPVPPGGAAHRPGLPRPPSGGVCPPLTGEPPELFGVSVLGTSPRAPWGEAVG